MKVGKRDSIYIFFIVLLSALLVGLFFLSISGWFYRDNKPAETSLIVGNSSVIYLQGTQSSAMSFNFDGAYLGGEKIKQNISVKNDSQKDLYLRAKLTIFSGKNDDPQIEINALSNWTKMNDGYYYFDGYVESLNTVGLLSSFQIASGAQLVSSSNYILVITVEGLSTEFDRTLVWGL